MKICPLGDRVAIKRDDAEKVSPGGIALPEQSQHEPRFGKVLAVGSGTIADSGRRIPLKVSNGDRVVFNQYAGTEVELGEETLLLMREVDILAVIK